LFILFGLVYINIYALCTVRIVSHSNKNVESTVLFFMGRKCERVGLAGWCAVGRSVIPQLGILAFAGSLTLFILITYGQAYSKRFYIRYIKNHTGDHC
jgi:hypothetical protein